MRFIENLYDIGDVVYDKITGDMMIVYAIIILDCGIHYRCSKGGGLISDFTKHEISNDKSECYIAI